MSATRYLLTRAELRALRKACKIASLSFPAMAARPAAARDLIEKVKAKGV